VLGGLALAAVQTQLYETIDCGEPRHIHVDRDRMSAKFWLDPAVSLAENYGFGRQELRQVERIVYTHVEMLRDEWDSFCG
jgi:hypothetical protein